MCVFFQSLQCFLLLDENVLGSPFMLGHCVVTYEAPHAVLLPPHRDHAIYSPESARHGCNVKEFSRNDLVWFIFMLSLTC